jgi:hypothetical protein
MMTNRIATLAATLALAMVLTLSCTNDTGNNGGTSTGSYKPISGSKTLTQTLVVKNINPNQTEGTITILDIDEYICKDGGVLEKVNEEKTIDYSISNKVLVLGVEGDTLNFDGTSSTIIGTWTRTKNKAADVCGENDYGDYDCKFGFDIVKAEISLKTFKITQDICFADYLGREGGFTATDCNTFEVSDGKEKIALKIEWSNNEGPAAMSFTYKNKTCKRKLIYTQAEMKAACKAAWDNHKAEPFWDDYYESFLSADFTSCAEKNFSASPSGSSMLMKKSSEPTPKKKNLFKKNPFGRVNF